MANNYTTLSESRASKKFILVRINPARYITDDLTLSSGTTYTATLPFITVNKIKVDNVLFAKVDTAPSASEFSYNETTKELLVNFGVALASQRVIAYHYLFMSTMDSLHINEDPFTPAGEIRLWENRINTDPRLSTDLSNVQQGYIRTSNVSIGIENIDDFIDAYLTDNDSFSKKEVKIWHCIDSVENISNFYTGYISSMSIGTTASISTDNAFTFLDAIAFKNGERTEGAYYTNDLFLNVWENDIGKPILEQLSRVSHFKYLENLGSFEVFDSIWNSFTPLIPESAVRAVNINANPDMIITNNRYWCMGYEFSVSGDHTDTIAGVSNPIAFAYDVTVADTSYFLEGDEVYINSVAIANGLKVAKITSATTMRIQGDRSFSAGVSFGDTIIRKEISAVWVIDNVLNAAYGTDWVVSPAQGNSYSLLNSNGYAFIVLDSTFESNIGLWPQPTANALAQNATVLFRRWSKEDNEHGSVIQKLAERSGITVNAASIATANATSKEVSMMIPTDYNTETTSIKNYMEQICSSTGAYVSLNSDNELVYELIDSPSSTDEKNNTEILRNTFNRTINYNDIVNDASFVNENNYRLIDVDGTVKDTINGSTVGDDRSKELHDVIKTIEVKHVLKNDSDISTRYLDLNKERKQLSTFKTKKGFQDIVGADIKYNFKNQSKSETIIKTNKNTSEQTIVTTDFLGV